MPDVFTSNLASRLSLNEDEVERQIERFVDTLIEEIGRNGHTMISDFGKFEFDDDEIIFTPDSALSESINYRYRTLIPIAIPGPETKDVEVPSASVNLEVESKDLVEGDTLEAVDPDEKSIDSSLATAVPSEKSDRPLAETQISDQQAFSKKTVLWLIPVLLLAAAIFLILDRDGNPTDQIVQNNSPVELIPGEADILDSAENEGVSPAEPEQDTNLDAAQADLEVDGIASEERSQTGPVLAARAQPETAPEASNPFVSDFERSAPGYTLVVGSVYSLVDAEREMQRFSGLSWPLAILQYDSNGVTRFRLAVGQFKTIDDAQQAMQDASENLPDGTWVRRIR